LNGIKQFFRRPALKIAPTTTPFNAMIGKGVDKEEFVRRVNAMDLSLPAKIHVAVPANQVCGAKIVSD
jgi:hypothetical protein